MTLQLTPGPGANEWSTLDQAVTLRLHLDHPHEYEFPWTMVVHGELVPTRGRRAGGSRVRRWRTPHDALEWVVRNIPSAAQGG